MESEQKDIPPAKQPGVIQQPAEPVENIRLSFI